MVKKKTNNKRIPPEKRMKRYRDFKLENVEWTNFVIVVPTDRDKQEVQAALEYLHNSRDIDTDFIPVNQLVHEYDHGEGRSQIIVDKQLYNKCRVKI